MKMSFAIILGGGLFIFIAVVMAVVFIPGWIWNPPQTLAAHPYTLEEQRGRELYWSNGCDYCHTQYVRYYDNNATGPISQGGSYVFDSPVVLGSERTGPDLSYIGRKRSEVWEIEHLKDPRQYSPMSIMPSFEFLPEEDLSALGTYLYNLGDRTAAEWMIQPPVDYAGVTDPHGYPLVAQSSGNTAVGWPLFIQSGLFDGKELYIEYCQTCHGCTGNGLGTYAGTKIVTPANFKAEPFRSMPDEQWFWHVSEGIPGSVMPPWKQSLSEEQRWNVIYYVQQIFAHPTERDPDEGDPSGDYANLSNPLPQTVDTLDQGKHIFIRECWVCHGDAGTGMGVYRDGILPIPPDFSDGSYGDYSDADYFWRISEGVPWTAMPTWKLRYSEDERWSLAYYIRVNFTQTLARPATDQAQVYPAIFLAQEMPKDLNANEVDGGDNSQLVYAAPNVMAGKSMYTGMCAHCHGLAGLGDGWDGAYLDVQPANFTVPDVQGLSDGDWFARVSYGLQDFAMPAWGEWMPIQNRWNVIAYIQDAITQQAVGGKNMQVASVFNQGQLDVTFAQVSTDMWESEVQQIDVSHGSTLYDKFCSSCHGVDGQGLQAQDALLLKNGLPYPAPMTTQMPFNYIFWRIWDGVPDTLMGPFHTLLTESDIYDLASFVEDPSAVPQTSPTPASSPTPSPTPGG